MSRADENADVVRRGYAAFNSADMKTLTEIFDESASWHTPGRSPIAGDNRGRDAVFGQFGRYVGETGGTFKATLQHVLQDRRPEGRRRSTRRLPSSGRCCLSNSSRPRADRGSALPSVRRATRR